MRALVLTLLASASLVSAQGKIVCVLPGPESFSKSHQKKNGSWFDREGRVIRDPFRYRHDSELRTTSLLILTLLGDGSTLRSGPYKNQIKRGVKWLLGRIDGRGRIALRSDLRWFTDHALATLVLAESLRLSKYRTLVKQLLACSEFLVRYLDRERVTTSPEFLFWIRALVDSLKACPLDTELQRISERLGVSATPRIERLRSVPPQTESECAIQLFFLVRSSDRPRKSVEVTAGIDAMLSRGRNLERMNPFAVAVYTLAMYSVGGGCWKDWQGRLRGCIVHTQITDGPAARSWRAPSDSIGPVQTTAWHTITLQCYYRYNRLQLAHL